MGRKKIDPTQRKIVSSFTLRPTTLIMLDNLAEHMKLDTQATLSRSQVVETLIVNAANRELGLFATEKHTGTKKFRMYIHGSRRYKDIPACNPYHKDGRCKNTACQAVYEEEGL